MVTAKPEFICGTTNGSNEIVPSGMQALTNPKVRNKATRLSRINKTAWNKPKAKPNETKLTAAKLLKTVSGLLDSKPRPMPRRAAG